VDIEWLDVDGGLVPHSGGRALLWAPQEGSQVDFLTSPIFETLLCGPRGTGKTDTLLMDFLQHTGSKTTPNSNEARGFGDAWSGILFRQSYPALDDVVSKSLRWFNQLPVGNRPHFNVGNYTWKWPTGESLRFRQLKDRKDYDKYHGHCLPPGSRVLMSDGSWKLIQKIRPFDWIRLPYSPYHSITLPVQYTTVDEFDGYLLEYESDETYIRCTPDHDVCYWDRESAKIRRKPFCEFVTGDEIVLGDMRRVVFNSSLVRYDHYVGEVFCLGIPVFHRFIAQQDGSKTPWMSGNSYPWIGFEELTTWATPVLYQRMLSLCRGTAPGMPRKIRSTTNPNGYGHTWVKKRFQLPVGSGRRIGKIVTTEGEKPRVAINSKLSENKVLLYSDPDYVKNLRGACQNESERAAWIDGSWDITSGGMFDDIWDSGTHVVPNIIGCIPHSWRVDRSFDWGSSSPASVGFWAESDGTELVYPDGTTVHTVRGDLFRIAEWYVWNGDADKPKGLCMLAEDIAQGIVQRQVDWGINEIIKPGPADNSINSVENGNCVASDMRASVMVNGKRMRGVSWTKSDKRPGSRVIGWQQMRKYLSGALNKSKLPRERPGLFICEQCVDFIRTVPLLPRDERKLDDIPTDNIEDHIADEARYRIRGRVPITQGDVIGG